MSTQASPGRIDLAKFRKANEAQRENVRAAGPEGHTIVTRAKIRLLEGQLKEAQVGDYTILCDEARSRKGGGKAPAPLQYFVAAVGF